MVIEEFPGTKEAKAHVTFMFAAALQDYAKLMSEIYELDKRDSLPINLVIPDEPAIEKPDTATEPTIATDVEVALGFKEEPQLKQKSQVIETNP